MSVEPSPYAMQLGARLKQARTNAELTQSNLAHKAGVTRSSIANMEAGRQNMLAESVVTYSALLECDPHWLLTGLGRLPTPPPSVQERILIDHIGAAVAALQDALDALQRR